ncbi:hypothetical protein BJY52DRAFT_1423193, partial [Lactarius psammicola]
MASITTSNGDRFDDRLRQLTSPSPSTDPPTPDPVTADRVTANSVPADPVSTDPATVCPPAAPAEPVAANSETPATTEPWTEQSWEDGDSQIAQIDYLGLHREEKSRDATCRRNGLHVTLVKAQAVPGNEPPMYRPLWSRELELATMPGTSCAPLNVIHSESGDRHIMVFPRLHVFDAGQIETFGEFATFFDQICKGIQYVHTDTRHNVTYRDWTAENIMVDPYGMEPDRDPASIGRRSLISRVFKTQAVTPCYYFIKLGPSHQSSSLVAVPENPDSVACHACRPHISRLHNFVYKHWHLRQKFFQFAPFQNLVNTMGDQTNQFPALGISDIICTFASIPRQRAGPTFLEKLLTIP